MTGLFSSKPGVSDCFRARLAESGINLICGDCLSELKKMADKSVDVVLTDPPYNENINYNSYDDKKSKNTYQSWCVDWFAECQRIASVVCFSPGAKNVGMWYNIKNPDWICCWYKPSAMSRGMLGFSNWEPMLLYGNPKMRNGCDVVVAPIIPDKFLGKKHPCPKPLKWALGFIKLLAKKGDTVLDPFMGSGTVGVACLLMGRKYIGVDIDENYVKLTEQRMIRRK